MRRTQCKYVPIELLDKIPDGLAVNCRWGTAYERAYVVEGVWYLVWEDRKMPTPDGVQVRRGLYDDSLSEYPKLEWPFKERHEDHVLNHVKNGYHS